MDPAAPSDAPSPPILRRIGLIGDVHGESDALVAVLDFLRAQPDLDALLCTGDVPGKAGESDSDACAHLLTDAGVWTIRGNHDRWALSNLSEAMIEYSGSDVYYQYAATLPKYRTFEIPSGPGLLCHGTADNDMAGVYPGGDDDSLIYALKGYRVYGWDRVMLCGHTHRRLVRTVGTITIINAGTLRRDNEPCLSVIDFETGEAQFYDLDPETHAITLAQKCRFGEQLFHEGLKSLAGVGFADGRPSDERLRR